MPSHRQRGTAQTILIAATAALAGLLAFVSVGAAAASDPATASAIDWNWLPMIGEEYCETEGGGLAQAGIGAAGFLFFVVIVAAAFIAAALESLPLTGWFNQVSFVMMGKIPIAIFFFFAVITLLTVAIGTYGVTPPPCIPIIG